MRVLATASLLLVSFAVQAQTHDLVGYWHNWNDGNAPYIQLDAIDPRYTVIEIAFAEPLPGTSHNMAFAPSGTDQSEFIGDVAELQAQGKKVLISIGGANATVHLDSDTERDEFVSSMMGIINTYGFDGIDIDLEGSSVSSSGGTIAAPIDAALIRLIDAIEAIGDAFETQWGMPMMLTMAPETAYVQDVMSAVARLWGVYLPIIDALRDRIDILQVQLYNSGSMYGIDGGIYIQGTADFIVSQTEATLQGFATGGGAFAPLPPEKIAIGLPACPNAAGGGYVSPAVLASAVDYLRGTGPQPGSYARTSTYPALRGLMTWSINWDAVSTCATTYEYADTFQELFDVGTNMYALDPTPAMAIWPTLTSAGSILNVGNDMAGGPIELIDMTGRSVAMLTPLANRTVALPPMLNAGTYVLLQRSAIGTVRSSRIVIDMP